MAEGAVHRDRLANTFAPFSDTAQAALAHLGDPTEGGLVSEAIRATDAETAEAIADVDDDAAMTPAPWSCSAQTAKGSIGRRWPRCERIPRVVGGYARGGTQGAG